MRLALVHPSRATHLQSATPEGTVRLEGWKQIAAYLHRDVRTVQRWERTEQLPVHRQLHLKLSTVHGLKPELERWLEHRSRAVSQRATATKIIAVRYFENLSDRKKKDDYFCDGFVEDLITSLSKLEGIRVLSRSAMARFRNSALDAHSVGKELRASHLVEGSLRRSGNHLRINAQLVDACTGHCLWAERFDRNATEALDVQGKIAEGISSVLQLTAKRPAAPWARFHTQNPQAYDLYLKGRHVFHQFSRTSFQRARELFRRAIAADPSFALAHAGFADCCSYLYLYWEPTSANLKASDSASSKANTLGPGLAEAHASRAVSLSTLRNYPDAEKEFQTAITLDPDFFEAQYFFGRAFLAQGKLQQALGPLRAACRVRPEDYQAPALLGMAYSGLGRKPAAAGAYQRSLEVAGEQLSVNPGDARALYLGAVSLARLGQKRRALAWAQRALDLDGQDSATLYNVACVYAVLDRPNAALKCLRKVVRSGWRKEWIRNDSDLISLRNLKEFRALTS
ncbi:MAG TPA: tetratricopeptide repeat protein [Candidatus Angelobacter sp.]